MGRKTRKHERGGGAPAPPCFFGQCLTPCLVGGSTASCASSGAALVAVRQSTHWVTPKALVVESGHAISLQLPARAAASRALPATFSPRGCRAADSASGARPRSPPRVTSPRAPQRPPRRSSHAAPGGRVRALVGGRPPAFGATAVVASAWSSLRAAAVTIAAARRGGRCLLGVLFCPSATAWGGGRRPLFGPNRLLTVLTARCRTGGAVGR